MNRIAPRRCLWRLRHSLPQHPRLFRGLSTDHPPPLVDINNATFYRRYPSETNPDPSNPPLFPDLTFRIGQSATLRQAEYWAIVSPSSVARTTLLQIFNNEHICIPPEARSYPYLSSGGDRRRHCTPEQGIHYVGFDAERGGLGGTSLKGAYLSARYEARKEETDWSLKDYLEGHTELNPLDKDAQHVDDALLQTVVDNLQLVDLLDRPVSSLSNGQTRRARIAKSLLDQPELLLLDGPFMGLDPPTVELLSSLLGSMARRNEPRIVLSLRPEDHLPKWISHMAYIDANMRIISQGNRKKVLTQICLSQLSHGGYKFGEDAKILRSMHDQVMPPAPIADVPVVTQTRDGFPKFDPPSNPGEPIVEMEGVKVSYGAVDSPTRSTVLGDWQQPDQSTPGLHWSIHRNQRWGIFGPNGSGKTTLLSLITSDHPQTYSLPIKLFGRSRLPTPGEPGISLFELQKRMGHSSPEVHTFFPKHLSVRRVLESAWADAPMAKPKLNHQIDRTVDLFLRWFAQEFMPSCTPMLEQISKPPVPQLRRVRKVKRQQIDETHEKAIPQLIRKMENNTDDIDWADTLQLRDLSFGQQRLALFLRALVAQPDLVILDEAFSGMDEHVRDKCLLFLSHGDKLEWVVEEKERKLKPTMFARHNLSVFGGLTEEQALLVISHSKEDVPGCVRNWICLPEPGEGKPARWGSLDGPLELNPEGWAQIWGTSK